MVESWSYDCLPYIVDEDWYRACVGACSVDGRHPDVDGEVAEGVLDTEDLVWASPDSETALEGATDALETKTVLDVAANALDTAELAVLKTTVLETSVVAALLAGAGAAVVYPAMTTAQKTALKVSMLSLT